MKIDTYNEDYTIREVPIGLNFDSFPLQISMNIIDYDFKDIHVDKTRDEISELICNQTYVIFYIFDSKDIEKLQIYRFECIQDTSQDYLFWFSANQGLNESFTVSDNSKTSI